MKISNRPIWMLAVVGGLSLMTGGCGSTKSSSTDPSSTGAITASASGTGTTTTTSGGTTTTTLTSNLPWAQRQDFTLMGYNAGPNVTAPLATFAHVTGATTSISIQTDTTLIIRAVARSLDKLAVSNNYNQAYGCEKYQIHVAVSGLASDPGSTLTTKLLNSNPGTTPSSVFCQGAVDQDDIDFSGAIAGRGFLKDANGNYIMEPVLDSYGNPVTQPKVDPTTGQVVRDSSGNIVMIPVTQRTPAPITITITNAADNWRCENVNSCVGTLINGYCYGTWYNPCLDTSRTTITSPVVSSLANHIDGGTIWIKTNGTDFPNPMPY